MQKLDLLPMQTFKEYLISLYMSSKECSLKFAIQSSGGTPLLKHCATCSSSFLDSAEAFKTAPHAMTTWSGSSGARSPIAIKPSNQAVSWTLALKSSFSSRVIKYFTLQWICPRTENSDNVCTSAVEASSRVSR